jgi:hypothetical protein
MNKNKITDGGLAALRQSLEKNRAIEQFSLEDNNITPQVRARCTVSRHWQQAICMKMI